jgi:hypothetical protein
MTETWDAKIVRAMAPVFQEWAQNMEERGLIRIKYHEGGE